ncbi:MULTISPECIES: hypothetical protein [Pseudomonas]|uniref:Ferritin-like domain-containing protein n=1 Tax=Pseudomonas gessardii TaxID=78544 RepID=A0A7Y1MNS9_9PSED|nr:MULTISPECIES: hypothetical protein [Pseudomonas]MBH3421679.1 hypothetical protein [Pseudomonas gessardii]MRU51817.1 hypothetical protein [Pseudomonas gessardii]NNA95302.1 hypothetical protein [Pseudomonas gessardii]SDR19391.1 hypothetical protein SAMN04490207_3857 [Pseudomonas gessardii]
MKPPFLKKRHWSARSLFKEISNSGWINPGIDPKYEKFFLADLFSEYDAISLYHYLYPKRSELSSYFVQYLDLWFLDERNHSDGFLELNRLLFNSDEETMLNNLKSRHGNFEHLEYLLSNEVNLLTLFAYDELISVKTYRKDTFYNEFGHPAFNTWISNLIADEATHFANAIKLLRHHHSYNLDKIEKALDHITQLESIPYRNTFLLDHDGPHFLLGNTNYEKAAAGEILTILARNKR